MKTWVIVIFAMALASCSYEFDKPPFPKDELTKITETEFGKELLSHIENFPDIEEGGNSGELLNEDTRVYIVANDFLIQQKEKDQGPGWELTLWTKNSHHIISCSLMQDENIGFGNVDAKKNEDGTIYLEGPPEELKPLAIQLSLEASKICIAFPYANASDLIDPEMEYKSQIERLTTELDVVTTTTTEYKKQIDLLNIELDVATNAMLREQEKAQDFHKLNQELDEKLSSSNIRFLILLGIGGIGAIAIIIIGVRSRLK
tara:strand:- start:84 stop:863 length:780 start_codon:yes stop_codon:yes gene_type:complete